MQYFRLLLDAVIDVIYNPVILWGGCPAGKTEGGAGWKPATAVARDCRSGPAAWTQSPVAAAKLFKLVGR
jgi:hypothetical protein